MPVVAGGLYSNPQIGGIIFAPVLPGQVRTKR
jgi:hypothetical protein